MTCGRASSPACPCPWAWFRAGQDRTVLERVACILSNCLTEGRLPEGNVCPPLPGMFLCPTERALWGVRARFPTSVFLRFCRVCVPGPVTSLTLPEVRA